MSGFTYYYNSNYFPIKVVFNEANINVRAYKRYFLLLKALIKLYLTIIKVFYTFYSYYNYKYYRYLYSLLLSKIFNKRNLIT